MAMSHQRQRITDLATESHQRDEAAQLPLSGANRDRAQVAHSVSKHTPIRGSHDGSQPALPAPNGPKPFATTTPMRTIGPLSPADASSVDYAHGGDSNFEHTARATKRMRFLEPESHLAAPISQLQPQPQPAVTAATTATAPGHIAAYLAHATHSGFGQTNVSDKVPSVRDINQALKSNSARVPLLDQVTTHTPRALQIGRVSQAAGNASRAHVEGPQARDASHPIPETFSQPHNTVRLHNDSRAHAPRLAFPVSTLQAEHEVLMTPPSAHTQTPGTFSRPNQNSIYNNFGTALGTRDSGEPRLLETLSLSEPGRARKGPPAMPHTSTAVPPNPRPQPTKHPKSRNHFTEEHDHFLIFLKEVKAYQWKKITQEFNAVFPSHAYHALQSRYSTLLNKRDRTQDPTVLSLPVQYASEATVDWTTVHRANPGRRDLVETRGLHEIVASVKPKTQRYAQRDESLPRTFSLRQSADNDYSSSGDSVPRRERRGRAAPVDYAWPRQRRRRDDVAMGEERTGNPALLDYESEEFTTATEEDEASMDAAVRSDANPIVMNFEDADASLALTMGNQSRQHAPKTLPYLSIAHLAASKTVALELAQDSQYRQSLQSCAWHVDFSPDELDIVEESVSIVQRTRSGSRHSTRRRQLRQVFKHFSEAALLQLSNDLLKTLKSRDKKSIDAFLQDAKAGAIADQPRIQRLAVTKADDQWSSRQSTSTPSIIRERELGRQSIRGWRAASKPLTYQIKNRVMDSFGAASSWTGASGDIHAVAWAADGEGFAAAAVAVDDPDSMQYNRPNNLLFGKCSTNTIRELGEHYREREKTAEGPNSTHAMFASQDPRIYNTVSSIGFSKSGKLLYSAGYDGSVCVWQADTEDQHLELGAKLNVKAPIDMIAVNPVHAGILAAAVKVSNNKAIKFLQINEDDPNEFERHNLHSYKAVSRPDLKILPTAIQFEPRYGRTLLAGFGANIRDSGFDTTGDVCLWDVETIQALYIHGASVNVFDIEFNPNRSFMPLFAVGCVAGNKANRGANSVVRLYDERVGNKYTCAREIECKALDINDVVWCPHDEYLIAAGCTDGRAYVWDVRYETDPLQVLSHGNSVMPLQDGIKHEYTDTGIRFLSWGENATRLYSGSSDGVVKVWDVTRSKEDVFIKDIVKTNSGIMAGAFSPDRSKLLIGEVDGSVDVLEVGRDGCGPADAPKLRYIPYDDGDLYGDDVHIDTNPDSGVAEGQYLLNSQQLQVVPMGDLPIRQVVQGPLYNGPYDQSEDAHMLREKAWGFQRSLAITSGPQCNIPACRDNINKTTDEEIGDSGRAMDRIPDALSRAWASSELTHIVSGKSKCTQCGRSARPTWDPKLEDAVVLCERCCFACFRCAAPTAIKPGSSSLSCNSCGASWEMGALGYEVTQQPLSANLVLDVPPLKRFGKSAYLDRLEDLETSFGDEMNALSDYYFSLALERPESPSI